MHRDHSSSDHAVNQSDIQSAKRRMESGEDLSAIMDTNSGLIQQRMLQPLTGLLFVATAILAMLGYLWVAVAIAVLVLLMWAYMGFRKLRNEDKKRHADMIKMKREADEK